MPRQNHTYFPTWLDMPHDSDAVLINSQVRKMETKESVSGEKALKVVERRYHVSPKNIPLEEIIRLSSIKEYNKRIKRKIVDLISVREKGYFKKNFQLDKIYAESAVTGVKEDKDKINLTKNLLYGLASAKPELVKEAENFFDGEKLELARRKVSRREIYKNLKGDIEKLKTEQAGAENASHVISFLRERYCNVREISDLLDGIEEKRIDYIIARTQKGTFNDLFDSEMLGACTFFPKGANKEESINYAIDPDIGLLYLIPKVREKEKEPFAVAICLNVNDSEGKKGLLIDSYEQGRVLKFYKHIWKPLIEKGLIGVAKDNDAKFILFNQEAVSIENDRLVGYIRKKYKLQTGKHYAEKIGMDNLLKNYGGRSSCFLNLEAFRQKTEWDYETTKHPEGIVCGVKLEIDNI